MTMRRLAILLLAGVAASCGRSGAEPASTDVRAARVDSLPGAPGAPAWDRAPLHRAALRPQDMVDPRKMEAGISDLRVRALYDGQSIAFRLDWIDPTEDKVRKPSTFGDACAIQVPAGTGPDLPAPQMGEPGKPVEIAYWSAAAEAGTGDDITALYPNARIDHYPFEAESLKDDPAARKKMALQYAPARSLGNVPSAAVQDLVAQGPGTLRPAPAQVSSGGGVRTRDGWSVVLSRPLPRSLETGERSNVSFAVWDGTAGDAGSRKMWTPWITLVLEDRRPAP